MLRQLSGRFSELPERSGELADHFRQLAGEKDKLHFYAETCVFATTTVDVVTAAFLPQHNFAALNSYKMKIVITGSLGHISKPLATALIQKGHTVTVISSNPQKQGPIEALGATAAIGQVTDAAFLTSTFTGADTVYCMVPPNYAAPDVIAYYETVGSCYAQAIQQSGVKRVFHLSSFGAHLSSGTGFITGSYKVEQLLNALPQIQLTHIRPGYFYYNLLHFTGMIKGAGFIGSVYGGNDTFPLVAPADIAAAIAEEILATNVHNPVRYVASDERTCNEIAAVLGKAIGIPDLKWLTLEKEQVLQPLLKNGMPENTAMNFVELGLAIHNGLLQEDFITNKPVFGKVKLEEYATEFATRFHQQ